MKDKFWYARREFKNATELAKVVGPQHAFTIYRQAYQWGQRNFTAWAGPAQTEVMVIFPDYENTLACVVRPIGRDGIPYEPPRF